VKSEVSNLRPDPPAAPAPAGQAQRARRTVAAGLVSLAACSLLVLSPLLLGRWSANRYLVAFGLIGCLLGGSFLLHGAWDWLAARRRQ
jgi:hypothetical protein